MIAKEGRKVRRGVAANLKPGDFVIFNTDYEIAGETGPLAFKDEVAQVMVVQRFRTRVMTTNLVEFWVSNIFVDKAEDVTADEFHDLCL